MVEPKYKRILIKLSGEALAGERGVGIDIKTVQNMAQEIKEVHELGIGGKDAPARLVFEGKAGSAIVATLVDMGGRMRLIVNDVECEKPIMPMPNLPVARVMWKPMPSLEEAGEAWILAGGAHHSVISYTVTAEQLRDWANMMGIEFVHITKDLDMDKFKDQLMLSDIMWKLK